VEFVLKLGKSMTCKVLENRMLREISEIAEDITK
jgi:hypothetical protein